MHQYYHSSGVTDLDVLRKDAMYRLVDKKNPEESLIHLHPKTTHDGLTVCNVTTADRLEIDDSITLKVDQDHEWILFSRIDPAYVHPESKTLTWKEPDGTGTK